MLVYQKYNFRSIDLSLSVTGLVSLHLLTIENRCNISSSSSSIISVRASFHILPSNYQALVPMYGTVVLELLNVPQVLPPPREEVAGDEAEPGSHLTTTGLHMPEELL